jgi:hypothetical protein
MSMYILYMYIPIYATKVAGIVRYHHHHHLRPPVAHALTIGRQLPGGLCLAVGLPITGRRDHPGTPPRDALHCSTKIHLVKFMQNGVSMKGIHARACIEDETVVSWSVQAAAWLACHMLV